MSRCGYTAEAPAIRTASRKFAVGEAAAGAMVTVGGAVAVEATIAVGGAATVGATVAIGGAATVGAMVAVGGAACLAGAGAGVGTLGAVTTLGATTTGGTVVGAGGMSAPLGGSRYAACGWGVAFAANMAAFEWAALFASPEFSEGAALFVARP